MVGNQQWPGARYVLISRLLMLSLFIGWSVVADCQCLLLGLLVVVVVVTLCPFISLFLHLS